MAAATCPYCNALLESAPLDCPRCGERLPLSRANSAAQTGLRVGDPVSTQRGAPTDVGPISARPFTTNRSVAFAVLGVMAAMASIGLAFALYTVPDRAKRHPQPPAVVPPLVQRKEPAIVGYMPKSVNLLALADFAAAREDPTGKTFLAKDRPGLLNLALATLEEKTSLRFEDLEQLAIGVELRQDLPQATILVQTTKPISTESLDKTMKRIDDFRGKPLFRFALQPVGQGLTWIADERRLVVVVRIDAVKVDDLTAIPVEARDGEELLPAGVRDLVQERVNKQSLLWAAGRFEKPLPKEILILLKMPVKDADTWSKLRAFTLSLFPQEGLTLIGQFQANEPMPIKDYLENLKLDAVAARVEAPPESALPEDRWVLWQVRMLEPRTK